MVTLEVAKQGAIYHGLATLLNQPSPMMQRRKHCLGEGGVCLLWVTANRRLAGHFPRASALRAGPVPSSVQFYREGDRDGPCGSQDPMWTCEPQRDSSGSVPSEPCHLPRPRPVRVSAGGQFCGQTQAVVLRAGRPLPSGVLSVGRDSVLRADTGHAVVRCRKAQVSEEGIVGGNHGFVATSSTSE